MTTKNPNKGERLRVGLVVPHIFMHRDILPRVIFSPGTLAIDLSNGLLKQGADVTLFSPGPVDTTANNSAADLSYFEKELAGRGDTYMDLLKKHPFTFVTLARQVQSELIAKAFAAANNDELDIIHIYTNEEDIALPFAKFCKKPVVFTHHDPFNFLVKYKSVFPKYKDLHWISMSYVQRKSMPSDTNWVANIYHGLSPDTLHPTASPSNNYVAFLGRIIEPKGVHIAIQAVRAYNSKNNTHLKLKIAGKHYSENAKDSYWQTKIQPELDDMIEYVGHLDSHDAKQEFLGNAKALIVPSIFSEPFGMVSIEALACGTPVVGLDVGATHEIIKNGKTGFVTPLIEESDDQTKQQVNVKATTVGIVDALEKINSIDRNACRQDFENRFTIERMCQEHLAVYSSLSSSDGTPI